MKLAQCKNGHYYDAELYKECPQCLSQQEKKASIDETIPLESGHTITETVTMPSDHSLQDVIEEVSETVNNYDETISFPTNGLRNHKFVVGWLVCTKGTNMGMSFSLYDGKNFIGRSKESDIILEKDKSVSRSKHAIIVYEPKEKLFIAVPGESKELYYVNGKVILSQQQINAYDKISIGQTELLFIPLCNEHFDWNHIEE